MARARDVTARATSVAVFITMAATAATVATSSRMNAQTPRRQPEPKLQPEVRLDFIDARAAAAHVGVGMSVPASTYVRIGIIGAAGQAWRDGTVMSAGRVDGLVRFVVDPLGESRWAPYASGGVGAIYDGSERWRAVLVGVLGVEGPNGGTVLPAIEIGFGGGARIGVALRRAMPGRR